MKSSRILSMLAAICLLPLLGLAQEEAENVDISISGAPGSVVVIDGEEVTIPASGELSVSIRPGASITTRANGVRLSFPSSGGTVSLGASSSLQITSGTQVLITSGRAVVVPTTGFTVNAAPGASLQSISTGQEGFQVIDGIIEETDEGQTTPPVVGTPT